MSRPKRIFTGILLALLVLGDCATANADSKPEKARKVKSVRPTRNEHYVKHTFTAKEGTAIDYWVMSLRPDTFAAAIPVAGGWDPKDAGKMQHIAIWVFHGDQDKVVRADYSRDMVDAIKKAGGSPKYTEYEGVGHNSWSKAYGSPETWKWLFQQKRNR